VTIRTILILRIFDKKIKLYFLFENEYSIGGHINNYYNYYIISVKVNAQHISDIQRIRNLTDDSSLGSFKNEVISFIRLFK